uniref:Tachykinin precursor 1 n=1 Tax=Salmo trutta TaxID=8032 RepID=A0A674A3D6_SALTR
MTVLKLVVLIIVVFAQVYCALGTPTSDDGDIWSIENWQVKLVDLTKRSKSQQVQQLVEKSSIQFSYLLIWSVLWGGHRNKDFFFGLMGRRSPSGGRVKHLTR